MPGILRMWLNAQQIMQWHWAWDARQISRQSTIQLTHFPFPSVEDSQLKGVGNILVLGMMRCLVVQATKPQKPQKCPNSGFRHPVGMIPTKGLRRFLNPILGLCRGLHAGKAIRPYLYSHFQTFGALGLPMCHIFQVSGSSLPVPIFIGR